VAKELYVPWTPAKASRELVDRCNEIIDDLVFGQGLVLTVRQLYYQLVTLNIVRNTMASYNRVKSVVSKGRMAGLIDWDAIEDRTREPVENSHWVSPASIMRSAARSYAEDLWAFQPLRAEVWCEKQALAGVFESICSELDILFFACRGYVSDSAMKQAAERHIDVDRSGQPTTVFHFGDHDPSGMDMTRDIGDKLRLLGARRTSIERVALNRDQVDEFDLPPNPAKATDSRSDGYVEEYGEVSWELDAIPPTSLRDMVRDAVFAVRDVDEWDKAYKRQEGQRSALQAASDGWDDVVRYLDDKEGYDEAYRELNSALLDDEED
jgi:hypothetical protein